MSPKPLRRSWVWRLGRDKDTGEPIQPWRNQKEAFDYALFKHQWATFIDMGMGKTGLTVNLAEYHRIYDGSEHCLILAPKDLAEDPWAEQVAGSMACDAQGKAAKNPAKYINICESDNREQRLKALKRAKDEKIHYIFINYDGLVSLLDGVLDFFHDVTNFMCVADESTTIKHWHTDRSKAAKRIGDLATWRTPLTGSPIPQGPQDIFGQYYWLDETIYGSRFVAFRAEYMNVNIFNGITGLRSDMHKDYYEKFHSIAIVQKKKDYSDIPDKIYETIHYDLEKDEKAAYKQFEASWLLEFGRAEKVNKVVMADNALTKSLRLAQICTGFSGGKSLKTQENVDIQFKSRSKIRALKNLIERLDGRGVIWCRWRKNVRDVLEMLRKEGITCVDYYGDSEEAAKNEEEFKAGLARVMVATPHKAARGKNWQGPDVKWAIYFSQDYTAEFRQQSEDRVHRGKIVHQVTIFDMVARGTIEAKIVKGLKNHENFQTSVMTDPVAFLRMAA